MGSGSLASSIISFALFSIKDSGNIHPLVTVFGVIAGIGMFGFIGLIFGPMLLSLFIVLLKVYSNEFLSKKRESKRANTQKNEAQ